MSDGFTSRVLHVDLSNHTYSLITLDETIKRRLLGGNGLGAYYLCNMLKPGIDPLSPGNLLIFATGPFTGTPMSGAGLTAIISKSPLTGLFFDSYFGGHFGPSLKYAGYDAILLSGKSPKPVYLFIDNGRISFEDASILKGLDTIRCQQEIRKRLGHENLEIACIGPAGENLVKFASIISGTRASGRGGMGAVMGSKGLKAVAVRGTGGVEVGNQDKFFDFVIKNNEKLKGHPAVSKGFSVYGSGVSLSDYSKQGILGTRNWQTETFEAAEEISPKTNIERSRLIKSRACNACVVRSSKVWSARDGEYRGCISEPEYETFFSMGSLCGNSSFDSIILADRICDEYGMDTMTAGGVIAFAMECYEKGILGKEETGMDLRFGDHKSLIKMLHKIANREELGDILAEGTRRAAEIIGKGSERYAIHTKGLEFAGHSARVHKGQAVGYATSNRGGSHQDTRMGLERSGKIERSEIKGKGSFAKNTQDMTALCDSLIVCRRVTEASFGYFVENDELMELINMVTGYNYDLNDIQRIGERVYNLERIFNVREGISRKDDTLPYRFLNEPIPDGVTEGAYVSENQLNEMLDEYYQLRGWDPSKAAPTNGTIRRLGLDSILLPFNVGS